MKNNKKIIIEDCKDPDTGEYPTWEKLKNILLMIFMVL